MVTSSNQPGKLDQSASNSQRAPGPRMNREQADPKPGWTQSQQMVPRYQTPAPVNSTGEREILRKSRILMKVLHRVIRS